MKNLSRKTLRLLVLGIMMLSTVFSVDALAAEKAQKIVKILAIGNSFSTDAVEQNLYELAQQDGITLVIGNMYIGGCSIERHVRNSRNNADAYEYRKVDKYGKLTNTRNFSLERALADEDWDYISMQQGSSWSGLYDTYEKWLPELVEYVKARMPKKTKLYWHQTWAYANGADHKAFASYNNDQMTMYNGIIDASWRLRKLVGIKRVIPCGTAIQDARTSHMGDTFNRDGYHLEKSYGRYLAACTWYEAILKRKVKNNPYAPAGLTAEQIRIAKESAHAAVKRPYKITQIK